MQYLILIVLAQVLYSAGDMARKAILHGQDFDWRLILSLPLWLTMALSTVAFVIQLFVMKHYDLSRTITILACCAIVFSVALGVVFFKEKFNLVNYLGVALAVVAVILTHVGHDS